MSRKHYKARSKKVQKLGRDGLVEKDKASGQERRISRRTQDVSFHRGESPEQETELRTFKRPGEKKHRQQARNGLHAEHSPEEPGTATLSRDEDDLQEYSEIASLYADDAGDCPQELRHSDSQRRLHYYNKPENLMQDPPVEHKAKKRQVQAFARNSKKSKIAGGMVRSDSIAPESGGIGSSGINDRAAENRPPGSGQKERHAENNSALKFGLEHEAALSPKEGKRKKRKRASPVADDTAGFVHAEEEVSETENLSGVIISCKEDAGRERKENLPQSRSANNTRRQTDGGGRPRFRAEEVTEEADDADSADQKQPALETGRQQVGSVRGVRDIPLKKRLPTPFHGRLKTETSGRLRFESENRKTEGPGNDKTPPNDRQDHVASSRENAVGEVVYTEDSEIRSRSSSASRAAEEPKKSPARQKQAQPRAGRNGKLLFEDGGIAPGSAPSENKQDRQRDSSQRHETGAGAKNSRRRSKVEKAERRVEQAEKKLDKAQSKLPSKTSARFEKEYDGRSGKARRRLRFEKELIPEGTKPALPIRAAEAAAGSVAGAALIKAHRKIRETERDNVAVEAAHKGELMAEDGARRALRWNRTRLRAKPYRAVRQAERRVAVRRSDLAWQTLLSDNPELQRKHNLNKWIQKRKLRRKYAQAAREAKQTAHFTQTVLTSTGKVVRAAAESAVIRRTALGAIALLALLVVMFSAGLASCTAMLASYQSSYISASYMADEQDICSSDLYYTELETDLQIDIDETETNYPGYDKYRYNIGEISHNPYELLGYLSTVYDAFHFNSIRNDILELFNRQYVLTREETEEGGDLILETTLTVTPLSDIISARLTPGEQTERYGVYMQTYGNRQAFYNPFDFGWLNYVSSAYGYRVHPISGEKNLHRGVDIGVAEGTPIKAMHDGRLLSAGEAGGYGLCVVIADDKGYQSRYAHCSSLNVSAGQSVKRGDVIAAAGSTGNSTGPHLHLEVMLNGEYLNPMFFVENGGPGGIAAIGGGQAYPGEAPTDETFAAMLQEAEKYLGYPYVWGGASPATSFDCSGFVCWVINHSGWNVGRLTAQGLYNICTPVSASEARPGDLIFLTGTYSTTDLATHVGIYVGNGMMIHAGNPISYADVNTPYRVQHFLCYGRLP